MVGMVVPFPPFFLPFFLKTSERRAFHTRLSSVPFTELRTVYAVTGTVRESGTVQHLAHVHHDAGAAVHDECHYEHLATTGLHERSHQHHALAAGLQYR